MIQKSIGLRSGCYQDGGTRTVTKCNLFQEGEHSHRQPSGITSAERANRALKASQAVSVLTTNSIKLL